MGKISVKGHCVSKHNNGDILADIEDFMVTGTYFPFPSILSRITEVADIDFTLPKSV